MEEIRDFMAQFERHRDVCARSPAVEAPFALQDSVEDAILDLLRLLIVCEREKADGGEESADPTEAELLKALNNQAGVGKKPPTVSNYCREVGNVVRVDAGLCVGESDVCWAWFSRVHSTEILEDPVIPNHLWEARYGQLVVKAVLDGVISQDFEERVQASRGFRYPG